MPSLSPIYKNGLIADYSTGNSTSSALLAQRNKVMDGNGKIIALQDGFGNYYPGGQDSSNIPSYNQNQPITVANTPIASTNLPAFNYSKLSGSILSYQNPTTGSSSGINSPVSAGFNAGFGTRTQTSTGGVGSLPSYGNPPAPAPLTPSDPKIDALTGQSLKNIGSGLRGELPLDVQQQIQNSAAERGMATGVGAGNAGAAMLRAMGLTSLDLQQAAEKNLQPYQERSAAVNLANIAQGGENWRALLDASEAMKRLQVSESGQSSRLSVQEQGQNQRLIESGRQALQQISAHGGIDLAMALVSATVDQKKQILAGAIAMQQLQAQESGQNARLNATMAADLRRQVLEGQQALEKIQAQGSVDLQRQSQAEDAAARAQARQNQYQTAATNTANTNAQSGASQQQQYALDQILYKYNLENKSPKAK